MDKFLETVHKVEKNLNKAYGDQWSDPTKSGSASAIKPINALKAAGSEDDELFTME